MLISSDVIKNIHKIKIRCHRYVQDALAGSYHSAFKGRGMEFEDVREYQPGDEVRSIDWNVTARMQTPYVKNFKEERELTVLILVDLSASSLFGTTGQQKRAFITEISALIAFSAVKNNDKVGLLLFTDQVEKFIPASKGMKHVLRVIRELMLFKPKGKKTEVGAALEHLVKIQKRKALVFVVSDFFGPCFEKPLMCSSRKHEFIGIQVKDPHEFTLPKLGLMQFKDLETNQIKLIDTSLEKVRKTIEEKNLKHIKEIQRQFESNRGGFVAVESGPHYMNALHQFFKGRHQKR